MCTVQVHEKVWKEMDENTIIIFPIEQYLNLLQGELDKLDSQPLDSSSEAEESLTEWFQKLKKKNPKKKLTLLIHGLQGYLRYDFYSLEFSSTVRLYTAQRNLQTQTTNIYLKFIEYLSIIHIITCTSWPCNTVLLCAIRENAILCYFCRKLKRKKNAEFRKGILNSDEQDGGTKKRKPSSRRGVGIELSLYV